MRWVKYLVIALLGAFTANFVVKNHSAKLEEKFEVILYTLSLCDHCAVFETHYLPDYKSHELSKTAPLVMINMDEQGTGPYHLKTPISHVPTAIIMKNGKEVARLNGLVDRSFFYAFVRNQTVP